MKALIINGSHRVNGNTWRFSNFTKEVADRKGIQSEIINLVDIDYEICNGCLNCEESGSCVLNDMYSNFIIPKLKEMDIFIFASPVYFNMPTALMKNFIDRTNCLCEYFSENTKIARLFLVGQADMQSLESAKRCYFEYFEIMGFDAFAEPIMRIARDADELVMDKTICELINNWFSV